MVWHLHVINRRGIFTWRRRLPAQLAHLTGQSHVTCSLKTRDAGLARYRALRLSLVYEESLAVSSRPGGDHRHLSRQQAKAHLTDLRQRIARECEQWQADRLFGQREQASAREPELYGHPAERKRAWQQRYHAGDDTPARDVLRRLMTFLKKRPDEDLVARLAPKAMEDGIAAFAEAERKLESGELDPYNPRPARGDAPPAPTTPARGAADAASARAPAPEVLPPEPVSHESARPAVGEGALESLQQAADAYFNEQAGINWKDKSVRDARTSRRLLVDWFGDAPIDTINPRAAREFQAMLGRLPAKQGKGPFAGLPLHQAIAEADALAASRGDHAVQRMSLKTANKHLSFARGVFEHVKAQDTRL